MRVDADVVSVLGRSRTEGSRLLLPEQLDRKLYLRTAQAIEAAGGKWTRGQKAHVFPGDAAEAIDPIILDGEIAAPRDFDFFETPGWLVTKMLREVGYGLETAPGKRVLEPSAGRGAIAVPAAALGGIVRCVEEFPKNIEALQRLNIAEVHAGNFLDLPADPSYDFIFMNPPFSKRQDIQHVTHATGFLAPGGKLVAIMSAGVTFREDRIGNEFRDLVASRGGMIEALPDHTFRETGTGVRTVMVTV